MSTPHIRHHADGRLAVESSPGYWVIITPGDEPGDAAGDQEVHESGWSTAAVVELPDPDTDAPAHPTWRDGCGNPWRAQPDGVIDEFGLLVRDVEKLRRTAAALLAACDAVEKLRADLAGES